MHREVVDGVPVLWAPGPAPLTAGLVFGVGRRDESFLHGGITHLVEHLAMHALGRTTLACNATVDLTRTEFTATGEPARVAQFLRGVCEALADLPLDRLPVEAQVLRAEGGSCVSPTAGALMAEQYGASGAGLAGFSEPALLALAPDDVRAWSRTWFVRGNAALWLTGPPPEGLSLPLADAELPARRAQHRRSFPVPALVEHGVDGTVTVGADVERRPGLGALTRVLGHRLEDDLRHRRGLTYSVGAELLGVEPDRRFVAVTADCHAGQEAVAARALWLGLTRLAESGPTEQELAHERAELAEYLADERSQTDEVQSAAESLVTGVAHRSADDLRREAADLTAEQVRSAAQALLDAALLGVPFGTEVVLSALTPLDPPRGAAVEGESFARRARSDAPRGARLVVGDDGVTVVLGKDDAVTVRFSDVVALLEVAPQEWSLVAVDGTSLPLAPRDWRDGDRALERVRAAVPASLARRADTVSAESRRVLLVHAPPSTAFESLWPSTQATWVAQTPAWTVVARDQDEEQAHGTAAGMSSWVGRRGAVLLLEQAHGELRMVLFHRGRAREQHLWTGEAHDPAVLAAALGHDPAPLAELLAHPGPPGEVLDAFEQVLGVPPQAAQLLAGAEPSTVEGLQHERPRGPRESFSAVVRGEYDPPDSDRLTHRLSRWERQRPPAYRLFNAGAAAVQAGLAGVAGVRADGDWTSWPGVVSVLLGLGAVGSLWSTRPPRDRSGGSRRDRTDAPG